MQIVERAMREVLSTVTTKGQVTIPIEIRRLLGVAPHDKVAFVVEENEVRLKRTGSVIDRTAGMLKSDQPFVSVENERAAAEEAIAEEAVRRMAG